MKIETILVNDFYITFNLTKSKKNEMDILKMFFNTFLEKEELIFFGKHKICYESALKDYFLEPIFGDNFVFANFSKNRFSLYSNNQIKNKEETKEKVMNYIFNLESFFNQVIAGKIPVLSYEYSYEKNEEKISSKKINLFYKKDGWEFSSNLYYKEKEIIIEENNSEENLLMKNVDITFPTSFYSIGGTGSNFKKIKNIKKNIVDISIPENDEIEDFRLKIREKYYSFSKEKLLDFSLSELKKIEIKGVDYDN